MTDALTLRFLALLSDSEAVQLCRANAVHLIRLIASYLRTVSLS